MKFIIDTSDLKKRQILARKVSPNWVTPHFHRREFDCKDGTGYVKGLMTHGELVRSNGRWRPLSRRVAVRRRRGLALRLETVRAKLGVPIYITSAYRTPAYNEIVGGETGSAHINGYAGDVRSKKPLNELREAMDSSFEGGIGYYPSLNFVHGDYDPKLGKRYWSEN